jgi:hypothetical protein
VDIGHGCAAILRLVRPRIWYAVEAAELCNLQGRVCQAFDA